MKSLRGLIEVLLVSEDAYLVNESVNKVVLPTCWEKGFKGSRIQGFKASSEIITSYYNVKVAQHKSTSRLYLVPPVHDFEL